MAWSTVRSWAVLATKFRSKPSSGLSRLMVGGRTPSTIAFTVATAYVKSEPVLVAPTEPEPPPSPSASERESEGENRPSEKKPSAVVTDVGAAVATPIHSRAPSAKSRSSADLVVYVLAAVVLALSVAGLVWLLQVG